MANWKQLGLKAGLEIHQQLEGKKLYCHCPTHIREDPPHSTLTREIRAAAGESGTIDIAAEQEMKKKRNYHYETYLDTTCLVEHDEEPPHPVNTEALNTALTFSKIVAAKPVNCVQAMRKTIADGSNTTGFQRTALISTGGHITITTSTINLHTIILEEDSARIINETPDYVTYRLDRLGIPLIEVCTAPELHTPEDVKEAAEKIGLLLRSCGTVKRGLGTIRQDVNVSITGGTRIEIKGAQDLKLLPQLVEIEAARQKNLLELQQELKKRKAKPQTPELIDVTEDVAHAGAKIIINTIKEGGRVLGCKLESYAGLLGKETQPGKRFGTELSDRAKIIAGVGGLFHSDELPKYGITEHEVNSVKGSLCCGPSDAFVLVATKEDRARRALHAVIDRANQSLNGVPPEVRKANDDGTTSYLRPMPGAARMYPETDIPLIPITSTTYKQITLPELIEERQQRYEKLGLSTDLAKLAAKSPDWKTFDNFLKKHSLKPAYLAQLYFGAQKSIKSQYNIDIHPTTDDFSALFEALDTEKISKESVDNILKENKPIRDILNNYTLLTDKELEKAVKTIAQKNKGAPYNALIGLAMKELRGKANGQKIAELVKKLSL